MTDRKSGYPSKLGLVGCVVLTLLLVCLFCVGCQSCLNAINRMDQSPPFIPSPTSTPDGDKPTTQPPIVTPPLSTKPSKATFTPQDVFGLCDTSKTKTDE